MMSGCGSVQLSLLFFLPHLLFVNPDVLAFFSHPRPSPFIMQRDRQVFEWPKLLLILFRLWRRSTFSFSSVLLLFRRRPLNDIPSCSRSAVLLIRHFRTHSAHTSMLKPLFRIPPPGGGDTASWNGKKKCIGGRKRNEKVFFFLSFYI